MPFKNLPLKEKLSLVREFNYSVPRYTSYPTVPHFYPISVQDYLQGLQKVREPFSLYIHIPFCQKMCLFCACSVVLNRKKENREIYLKALFAEMELFYQAKGRIELVEIHLGGGTPTSLEEGELEALFIKLKQYFIFSKKTEIAIEVDPRSVFQDKGKKLRFLKDLGVDRISFGVQDLDSKVQEAIKRRQSYRMTLETIEKAKKLNFSSINVDLIYGLPLQSLFSFTRTLEEILLFSVDRIALFSYAHVPWLKKHQRALEEKMLPSSLEKFQLYQKAKELFQEKGYVAIGMDHFAKKEDSLVCALKEKKLIRNFQGYAVQKASQYVGLGVTSIGFLQGEGFGLYVQNVKTLSEYYALIRRKKSPVCRGFFLTPQDQLRYWVIQQIMCYQRVEKKPFLQKFAKSFEELFFPCYKKAEEKGFLQDGEQELKVTEKGSFFLRNIASLFDAYYEMKENTYAKGI